jgi:hypothetical protein
MTGKTKFIPAIALSLGLIIGLVLLYQQGKGQSPTVTNESTTAITLPSGTPSVQIRKRQTPTSIPNSAKNDPSEPVDPREWLENGPKEPLEPPEMNVEAELAPGSVATDEPLVPREIVIDADVAPGESITNTPLTPPEVRVDEPDP